jgi:EAL domain-containing protein (putative c-di-GMP-specific phosphodiesterase class I)/PleD family two-component response regulator
VMRVLVVEDSRTQALALREELEGAGMGVMVAGGGAEAMTLVEVERFDVIVSDVVMPGMDGYELCGRLKGDPRCRETPVVLLTSLSDPLDVVRALESGADNFMRKPYQPEQLIGRLYAAAHTRELRQTGQARMGVRLSFMDRVFDITADRRQILDLLISTFEELVVTSREMRKRESALADANAALEQHLQAVDLAHGRLQAVMESVPVPLFVLDPNGCVTHVSEPSANALGATTTDLLGRRLDEAVRFVDKEGSPVAPASLPHHQAVQLGHRVGAGTAFDLFIDGPGKFPVPVVLYASPVLDARGRPAGCVGTAHVLDGLIDHDPLTGLPNSAAFLNNAVAALASSHANSALLLLELDRFDVTRVSHDAATSNEALVEVSRRLGQLFAPSGGSASPSECFLGYLGGCQFGVVLANLPGTFNILHLAEAARRDVASIEVRDSTVRLTASVGVALAERSHPGPALLGAAGAALQRAHRAGGDRVEVLGQAASQDAIDRLHLEIDLRTALETGGIELHYQPEIDLVTGRIIGFEALARWQHEQLGQVFPAVFISVAEESGLIVSLGRRILAEACRRTRLWQDAFDDAALTIAVNVSAKQLRTEFVEEVAQVLEDTGLSPTSLTLELTETAAMSEPEKSLPILQALAGLGVRLSLDDFGTGYSSMAYLTQINFDQLKLDRGFVNGVTHGGSDAIVAQSIIALGHSLGVPVLAEGVEQPQQADILRQLGCDQAQGYLFGKPINPQSAQQLLEDIRHHGYVLTHRTGTGAGSGAGDNMARA